MQGVQVGFALNDCTEVGSRCGRSYLIDIVLININIRPGTRSGRRTYSGTAGIARFTISYSVRCALGYYGDACDRCLSLNCGQHGRCIGNIGGISCVCDPGYSGTRCQIYTVNQRDTVEQRETRTVRSEGSSSEGIRTYINHGVASCHYSIHTIHTELYAVYSHACMIHCTTLNSAATYVLYLAKTNGVKQPKIGYLSCKFFCSPASRVTILGCFTHSFLQCIHA